MEDNQTKAWATQLGLTGNFTVTQIRLDLLESQMRYFGKAGLAELYLTPEEQRCFFEFTYGKRQTEWLGGRICAKYAATRLLQPNSKTESTQCQDWAVLADVHGKPFLKPSQCEHNIPAISISHSDRLAVAMAAQVSCGIDIQKIIPATIKIQDRFSNADERLLLATIPGLKTTTEITRLTLLWSAKEAIRKTFAVRPLPGFMEIEQVKIDGSPDGQEGVRLDFVCRRDTISAHHSTEFFQVMAMLHDEFALALTVAGNRDHSISAR